MLTTDQKSDLLFKKYLGKGSSGTTPQYFNEPLEGRTAVYPTQIWSDFQLIPTSSAPYPNVVVQMVDLSLIQIPGPSFVNAFYHNELKDAIPFNFDPSGSYVPVVKKSDNTVIPLGQNDWFIDTEAGMLTFYGGLPSGVDDTHPPKVTFWKYIGNKGGGGGSGGSSLSASWASSSISASYAATSSYLINASFGDYMSGQIESPTIDNVYFLISNNPSRLLINSMTMALYSGTGTASLKVDNIGITGITDIGLTSIETTYNAMSPYVVPAGSRVILQLYNMSVGSGRFYFTIGMTRYLF